MFLKDICEIQLYDKGSAYLILMNTNSIYKEQCIKIYIGEKASVDVITDITDTKSFLIIYVDTPDNIDYIYYHLIYILPHLKTMNLDYGIETMQFLANIKLRPMTDVDKQLCKINKNKIDSYKELIKNHQAIINNIRTDKIKRIFRMYKAKVQTIKEVCTFIPSGKHNPKKGKETGKYPLYYNGTTGPLYTDTYDEFCNEIIINRHNDQKCEIYNVSGAHSVCKNTIRITPKDESIDSKYLYYYLLGHKDIINNMYGLYSYNYKIQIGMELFRKMQIIIPSLENQKKIIHQFDLLEHDATMQEYDIYTYQNHIEICQENILSIISQ